MSRVNMLIVINVWSRALEWLPMTMASLRAQSYLSWEAVVTADEADGDRWYYAHRIVSGEPRARLRAVKEQQHVVANTWEAISERPSAARPEDIIVILDGDDWLCRRDAMQLVVDAHEAGAWVTYGSWISNASSPGYPQRLPAYPPGANVRQHPWLASHLRSFRRGLFDRIKPEDFKDGRGEWFRCCPDLAVMIPAIEMAGWDRVKHIPEPIYFYNRESGSCVADTRRREQIETERAIRSRRPYERLEAL